MSHTSPTRSNAGGGRPDAAEDARLDGGSDTDTPDTPVDIPKAGRFAILKRSVREFKHDDITDRAAALTYFGVLALFPAMLVVVSVLGLLGKSTANTVLNNLGSVAPGSVHSFLKSVITQVQGKAGTAGIAAIIGLAVALWSASGYIAAFMRASNAIYEVDEGRPIWKTAPVRLLTTLVIVVLLLVAAAIVVLTGPVAENVGKAIGIGSTAVVVWDVVKWPVLIVLVSIMVTILYKATPNVKQPSCKWVSAGGVLAVILWVLASAVFAVYVTFSSSYNKTYGSLATVIIFLVWLWITNIAILLGAEFNAELQRERALRAGLPEDVEPFVDVRDTRKLDEPEKKRVQRAQHEQRKHLRDD
jgi:membrane protein